MRKRYIAFVRGMVVISLAGLLGCDRSAKTHARADPSTVVTTNDAAAPDAAADVTADVSDASDAASDDMIAIPAGSRKGGPPVAAFSIDRTEVSGAAYARCVAAGRCTDTPHQFLCVHGDADLPINCVTHAQAVSYCAFRGARLPTAEEWDYAARGTDGRRFPWGNRQIPVSSAQSHLCAFNNSAYASQPCAIGSAPKGASPFGLLDAAGNVAEWTSTPLGPGYAVMGYCNCESSMPDYPNDDAWWAAVEKGWRTGTSSTTIASHIGVRCAR